jgi:hypothetical protein
MKGRVLKDVYETPWAQVRRVFLEGVIADSCDPVVSHSGVEYTPYAAPVEDERDVELY